MPAVRTLATNLTGAIGCDLVRPPGAAPQVVFVDYNAGSIHRIDLSTGADTEIGRGYGLLEDIVVAPDGRAYVTERQGTLLRVNLAQANRGSAQVLASGLTAPQQIALSPDGNRAYTVEYAPTGRLLAFDLTAAAPQAVTLIPNLHDAVGIAISADERFALVSEQTGPGTVTRYGLDTNWLPSGSTYQPIRQLIVSGVPSPFFIRWADAHRRSFFLPLRDPNNRIVKVLLSSQQPTIATVLQSVPFRPSSVLVTPRARLLVCSDEVVGEWQLPTAPDSSMVIRGIVYDPPGPDLVAERIVLQNTGTDFVDLFGWQISDAANHTYGFSNSVAPGDVVRLWTKVGTGNDEDQFMNRGSPIWNNTPGDVAHLRNAQGVDVATYTYSAPAAVKANTGAVAPVGIGGGGAMYSPVASPNDPTVLFVCCDMGGLYRSQDSGANWQIIDRKGMAVPAFLARDEPSPKPIAFRQEAAWKNVIVASGRFHGLRYSTNLGATWTDIPTTWPAVEVTALGVDANGRLFVGLTHAVYYYDPAPTGGWAGPPTLAIQNIDPVVGFVLSADAAQPRLFATRTKVYRSTNSGVSWVDVDTLGSAFPLTGPARQILDIGGGSGSGSLTVYVTLATSSGVHVSRNGGQDWTRETNGLDVAVTDVVFQRLGVSPNNSSVAYVSAQSQVAPWPEFTNVYRTTDGGASWKSVFGAGSAPKGWVEAARSGFGGSPYALIAHWDASAARATALATNDSSVYAVDDSLTSTTPAWRQVYSQSDTSTVPPTSSTIGLEVTTVWHYDQDPNDPTRHYISYTDIGFVRGLQQNPGTRWAYDSLPAWRSNCYQLAFDPGRPGTMWMAASDQHDLPEQTQLPPPGNPSTAGGVLRSNTHGDAWSVTSQNLPHAPAVSIVFDPNSPPASRQLWVSMFRQGVYRSVDDGSTWQVSSTGLTGFGYLPNTGFKLPLDPHAYRLFLHADGTLFCALTGTNRTTGTLFDKESGLFRSNDDGGSWSLISPLLEFVIDYAVDPTDSRVVYLCTTGVKGADGAVRKTEDGGASWQTILDLVRVGATAYIDFFHAFSPFLHPLDANVLFVATSSHGIWTSRDAGKTWNEFSFPFTAINRLALDRTDPTTLYVCTYGEGVQRVTLV